MPENFCNFSIFAVPFREVRHELIGFYVCVYYCIHHSVAMLFDTHVNLSQLLLSVLSLNLVPLPFALWFPST